MSMLMSAVFATAKTVRNRKILSIGRGGPEPHHVEQDARL